MCHAVLTHFSCVWLCATLWTVTLQPPLSMGFSRQEYWSGFLCPSPGDLSDPGIEPESLKSPASAGRFLTPSSTTQNIISPGLIHFITVSFYLWASNRYLSNKCPISIHYVPGTKLDIRRQIHKGYIQPTISHNPFWQTDFFFNINTRKHDDAI